jgi:predicted DNA-binding protein (MmcQ/YjbR family)
MSRPPDTFPALDNGDSGATMAPLEAGQGTTRSASPGTAKVGRLDVPMSNAAERALHRVRALCLALPDTSERISWGHPNFRAGRRTFAAFERVQDRPSIAFRLEPAEVERLLRRNGFFATPYGRGLWVSLWADGAIDWKAVSSLVKRSYRTVTTKPSSRSTEKSNSRPRR